MSANCNKCHKEINPPDMCNCYTDEDRRHDEEIAALRAENDSLTAKVKELEAQVKRWADTMRTTHPGHAAERERLLTERVRVMEPLCRLAAKADSLAFENPEDAVRLTPALKEWERLEKKHD